MIRGRRATTALLLLLALLAASCDSDAEPEATAPPGGTAAPTASARPALAPDLALGQMVAISFAGREVTPALRRLIIDGKAGTVLLFPANFRDVEDLRRLISELRLLGLQAGLPAPPLIAVDQEGGEVQTVGEGIAALDDALNLGSRGPKVVRSATAATSRGLHQLGIRLDLAPVADVRSNPDDAVIGDRAFGSDAATVAPLVAAAVGGLHDGGVGATLKHFPGLGGAAGDPHRHLPTDPVSPDVWRATQRRAFAAGLRAGADAVMTTAVAVPRLDPGGLPALFSRRVVEGLLREGLGFEGVIVTDSLSLGGIGERYPLPAAAVAAARAGNDLLLLSNADPVEEALAMSALRSAVADGSLPATQVQRSAARVLALNRRWNG